MPFYISPPPRRPGSGILAAIVGALVLTGVVMLGFVFLVAAMGLGVLLWAVAWVRLKWLQHKMRNNDQGPAAASSHSRQPSGDSIDAEYTVVSRDRDSSD